MNEYTTNNLFAAEEWEVIFNAYRNISIKAFDYDNVMAAMKNYLKVNNPEEYDTIMKNGIMSIHLDMVARLSHSLSYRYEMAARENFFDTATVRENVIKLAKAFSYKPKRNRVANGLCRIAGIRTSEPVFDGDGNSISSQTIRWNQAGDPNWQEKFYKILNLALTDTNPFGRPLKRESIYNTQHELYALDRVTQGQAVYPFTANVNNERFTFEMVGTDIQNDVVVEDTPNPNRVFKLLYKNDRGGNFSPNTGFFVQVKQGSLFLQNTLISNANPDRVIDLDVENINETDVWVLETYEDGTLKHEWESVNNLSGQQVDYENIFNNNRKLYTIETRDENQISIHFGDGVATDIPKGNFNLWYRTSRNEYFSVKEEEIFEVPVQVPYIGQDGQRYQLTVYLSNTLEISNSEPEESVYRIKRNSPLAHYTQDRMINAEDYNIYPQTRTSLIKKQKTVNRTHPGHSRFMDIYDDTNEISLVTINADDGYMFTDDTDQVKELDITFTTNYENEFREIINTIAYTESFINYSYYEVLRNPLPVNNDVTWNVLPDNVAGNMGYFTKDGILEEVGNTAPNMELQPIHEGAILHFEKDGMERKTFIQRLSNNGIVNPSIDTVANITLGDVIPDGFILKAIIPNVRLLPNEVEIEKFAAMMEDELDFTVYYNFYQDRFDDNVGDLSVEVAHFEFETDDDDYGKYVITIKSLQYIIASNNDVRFFHKPDSNLLDPETLLMIQDSIVIEDGNSDPKSIKDTFLSRVNKSNTVYFP